MPTDLHVAVGGADEAHDAPDLGAVRRRLRAGPHVRLRHDLQQRHARAVVVRQRVVGPRQLRRPAVRQLACSEFEVRVRSQGQGAGNPLCSTGARLL